MEDWPAQIAQVALWLTDHQLNMELSQEFGLLRIRLPLTTAPHILVGNALREDWADFVKPGADTYCVGNPPFIGHQYRSAEQQADMHRVWGRDGKVNRLDYVTCWYRKAVDWMAGDDRAESCFVSTNSICQGEQVGTLWGELLQRGVRIRFAHRTFQWTSEARGKAAVHCVIIGFGLREPARRLLFDYPNIRGEPQQIEARNINPYLVDAANVLLPSRTETPSGLPQLKKGSQPTDGGHLIMTEAEKDELLSSEPDARALLRKYLGGEELINGDYRWCLWLKDVDLKQLRAMPRVLARIAAVREARLRSPTPDVRRFADFPTLFTQDRQPDSEYLALPEVSSENRRFVPMAFLPPSVVASNKLQIIVGATNFHFAILNST
ncbi:MAG: DNA methyltransferase, partial [Pseudomonadota bacterium]